MNSACGLFEGAQKSDEKPDLITRVWKRFRSAGIRKSGIF
jgi:hypothetical protein